MIDNKQIFSHVCAAYREICEAKNSAHRLAAEQAADQTKHKKNVRYRCELAAQSLDTIAELFAEEKDDDQT